MAFRFYSNMVSQASVRIAGGIFLLGLMLVGFGMLIYILRDIFAIIFAAMFFIAGIGCGVTAIKILLTMRKINKFNSNNSSAYRENVQIHTNHTNDF